MMKRMLYTLVTVALAAAAAPALSAAQVVLAAAATPTPSTTTRFTCGEYCPSGPVPIGACSCEEEDTHAWYDVEPGLSEARNGSDSHDCQMVGYHGGCEENAPEEVRQAYQQIMESVGSRDAVTILTLARVVPEHVVVDHTRKLALIRSYCTHAFIASVSYATDESAIALAGDLSSLQSERARAVQAIVNSLIIQPETL